METRREILFLFFLSAGTFFFSAVFARAAEPTIVQSDVVRETTWTKVGSPYLISGMVEIKELLTIEAGTVVKFQKDGHLLVGDELIAVGTEKDRIIFTSERDDSFGGDTNEDGDVTKPDQGDWRGITIGGGRSSGKIKHASILYAGGSHWLNAALTINNCENVSLTKSEVKHSFGRGISIIGAPPKTIEENVISNNNHCGVYASTITSGKNAVIRYNSIFNNRICGAQVYKREDVIAPPADRLDARENWWGDESGPKYTSAFGWDDNRSGTGNKIFDGVLFNPWLEKDPNDGTPDPVIIIPGIMGSWEVDGVWKIDPILRSYENLKKAMDENGYTPGEDMFDFPYQWRNSNVDNAELLRNAIDVVKEKTGRPKVDLVAHSMGGLLAREYIESDYYQNDIDQLITLGTPHAGAPKAYLMWEAGESDSYLEDKILEMIFNREAEKAGFENLFYYAHEKIPSLRELLPVYDYLFDLDLELPRIYPEKYPNNIFLENLNNDEKVNSLEKVEFGNIYGKTNKKTTIGGYNVINAPAFGDYWKDGYPKDFNLPWSDDGFSYADGDGTVPVESVKMKKSNYEIEIMADHTRIPTEAQQDVIELLTGKRPANKITSEGPEIKEILLVQVYCPVDLRVISPSGDATGMNFESGGEINEIPGATYVNNGENEEFVFVPNPEDGEYKILIKGTGEGGEYKIETSKIAENKDDPQQVEDSTVQIEGLIETGKVKEEKIEVSGNEVIYNPDSTPPTITVFSPEEIDYTNDGILYIDYSAEDAESGVESDEWDIEKDGQKLDWPKENIDLSLEHLGEYILKVSAADKAGNSAEKEVKFQITTGIEAIRNNVNHYFDLGLIKKKIARKYLMTKLKHLKKLFDLLEKAENSKLKPKPKQATVNALKKIINADIDRLIKRIKRKSPCWIDSKAAELLIEDLGYLKI